MGQPISCQLLFQLGAPMRGKIISRQWCPVCGARGKYILKDFGKGRRALVCICGQFVTNRLNLRFEWQGRSLEITTSQTGHRFTTYEAAELARAQINEEIATTLDPEKEGPAFNPDLWTGAGAGSLLWENYWKEYLAREKERLPRASYIRKRAIGRHLAPLNGRQIRTITAGDLTDLIHSEAMKKALSPKSRALIVQFLHHLFSDAVERGVLHKAPAMPKVKVPKKPIPYLNPEQQNIVLAKVAEPHQPILAFMFEYGPRPAEAGALCWDMVDLPNLCFTFARTFSARRMVNSTKARQAFALPIMEGSWFHLWLKANRRPGKSPVFVNQDADTRRNPERYYLPDFIRTIWREALEDAEFPHIHLKNATRHSAGRRLRDMGWDSQLIARFLGQASDRYTMKFYVEDDTEQLRANLTNNVVRFPAGKAPGKRRNGRHN